MKFNRGYSQTNKREPLKYNQFWNGRDQGKTLANRSWDDTGNADRFMDRFGDLS